MDLKNQMKLNNKKETCSDDQWLRFDKTWKKIQIPTLF